MNGDKNQYYKILTIRVNTCHLTKTFKRKTSSGIEGVVIEFLLFKGPHTAVTVLVLCKGFGVPAWALCLPLPEPSGFVAVKGSEWRQGCWLSFLIWIFNPDLGLTLTWAYPPFHADKVHLWIIWKPQLWLWWRGGLWNCMTLWHLHYMLWESTLQYSTSSASLPWLNIS